MDTEVEMTIDERYKYLRKQRERYHVADRSARGRLLDEMQAVTGLHRKRLVRRMNSSLVRKPRKQERQNMVLTLTQESASSPGAWTIPARNV